MSDSFIIAIFYLLVAFQSLFFSIFLVTFTKHKNRGSHFLALYLIITSIHFANASFQYIAPDLYIIEVTSICANLYGPVLFYYLAIQLGKSFLLFRKRLLLIHFIPFCYIFLWSLYVKPNVDIQNTFTNGIHIPTYIWLMIYFGVFNYWLYQKREANQLHKTLLFWLRFLYGMFLVLVVTYTLSSIFYNAISSSVVAFIQITNAAFCAFFISALLFLALRYPDLISKREYLKDRIAKANDNKYSYSRLGQSESERILISLKQIMESKKVYKIPGLTLEMLGEYLDVELKYISQTINQRTGKNFKEYINEMRVIEAARMFTAPKHGDWRVNEVMYDVGFRSKSSFNSNFKKCMGFTPKEYRKKYGTGLEAQKLES